jgi:hypothetical protein
MQMAVIDEQFVIIFDRAEANPLHTSDGNNAWSALVDTYSHTVRALKLITNSFCAGEGFFFCPISFGSSLWIFLWLTVGHFEGGGWLSNGTLVNYGGTDVNSNGNGYQGIRLFTPQPNGAGDVFEEPANIHLTTNR